MLNLASETTQVEFDPALVTVEDFETAIANADYSVADYDADGEDAIESKLEKNRRKNDSAKPNISSGLRLDLFQK